MGHGHDRKRRNALSYICGRAARALHALRRKGTCRGQPRGYGERRNLFRNGADAPYIACQGTVRHPRVRGRESMPRALQALFLRQKGARRAPVRLCARHVRSDAQRRTRRRSVFHALLDELPLCARIPDVRCHGAFAGTQRVGNDACRRLVQGGTHLAAQKESVRRPPGGLAGTTRLLRGRHYGKNRHRRNVAVTSKQYHIFAVRRRMPELLCGKGRNAPRARLCARYGHSRFAVE